MADRSENGQSLEMKSSKPLVGVIDPILRKSEHSRRSGLQQCSTRAHLNMESKLYRYRFSRDHVYLPEVRQHVFFDYAEHIVDSYPDVIGAIMVIGWISTALSIIIAIVLHFGFRAVLDEDWSKLKTECKSCWKYMTYNSGVSLDKVFTHTEQFMVPLVSAGVGILTAVCLRFLIKPVVRRYGHATAAAVTITWYLIMLIGELVILNHLVLWNTPIQKVGVNVIWMISDGLYCVYLGSTLMQGKLRLKESIPVFYFYSSIFCVTVLTCFCSCLVITRIKSMK